MFQSDVAARMKMELQWTPPLRSLKQIIFLENNFQQLSLFNLYFCGVVKANNEDLGKLLINIRN